MSLLPTDNPVVRASIEAGVGQQELLWLAAEGTPADLEAREAWAEHLVDNLLTASGLPDNGLDPEGRISAPMPAPGPGGASLWPPLLAAGSFLEGDGDVGRLVTEKAYALAPMLLGDRLEPLRDPAGGAPAPARHRQGAGLARSGQGQDGPDRPAGDPGALPRRGSDPRGRHPLGQGLSAAAEDRLPGDQGRPLRAAAAGAGLPQRRQPGHGAGAAVAGPGRHRSRCRARRATPRSSGPWPRRPGGPSRSRPPARTPSPTGNPTGSPGRSSRASASASC